MREDTYIYEYTGDRGHRTRTRYHLNAEEAKQRFKPEQNAVPDLHTLRVIERRMTLAEKAGMHTSAMFTGPAELSPRAPVVPPAELD